MKFDAYPLQFEPILKDRIWGGTKLKSLLNKSNSSNTTGESWELSTVSDAVSVVSNGTLAGIPFTSVISQFPHELLGEKVYKRFGEEFPLLFKFIDATEDLSIQVHPNDELAKKRHNSFGKTEMWYIMHADENARIVVGFKKDSSAEEYLQHLKDKTLMHILEQIPVKAGDVFLLETGTVHAIGGGIVLAEIQQTSDITYRLYDFDRVDANGNERELHVEQALDAIDYNESDAQKLYGQIPNQSNLMVDCEYFTTNFLPLDGTVSVQKDGSSFTVYMCVEGNFFLRRDDKEYTYQKGDTIFIPAALKEFSISGDASILEIYIS
ncbi:MAG TPA: type I phosphomannose isomerase catalytic subunit [Flavobacterium sp.]|jgi:mannose-6-phosphate isomerase